MSPPPSTSPARPPLRAPSTVARVAFSVAEAAGALGLHEKTVRDLVARGELEASRVLRRVLIPARALEALLARNRIGVV